MEASELRKGNLVWACGDAAQILTIDEGFCKVRFLVDVQDRPLETVIDIENIEPIQLTEEWLKDFGFVKEVGKYSIGTDIRKYYIFIDHLERGIFPVYMKREEKFSNIATDLKYVHQLQNLYFALTSQELEIKALAP